MLIAWLATAGIAQTTLSTTTTFTNNNGSGTVTFNLQNTNVYGIIVTDIAGVTGSSGNLPVEVWYKTTPVNGSPGNISVANGWIQAAAGTITGVPNTTTTNTQPFFTGINLTIPANTTYGIAVFAQGQRYHTINPPVPVSISAGGVNFLSGPNIGYGGGTPPATPGNTPRGWIGTLTFIPAQYFPQASGGGTYCQGSNVLLSSTAPTIPNPIFLWKLPDGTYNQTQNLNLNNIQPTQSGTYTVYVLTPNGPLLPPDTSGGTVVPVNVDPIPPKPIVAPIIVYCQNDLFDTIPIFGQNLKWYSVPTGGIPTTTPPLINTAVFGTSTYYVSQTVNNCESERAMVTVNVVAKPGPPQVVSPIKYCQGDSAASLIATGQNILWYSIPTGGVGTPITPTPGTNAQGTFTWYVSQTVAGCESDRIPVEVKVSYIPNALITLSKPYVCQYDTISLGYFGNATPTADYIWTLPNGATSEGGSGQGPLVVRFDTAGNMVVKLKVDNSGCVGPEATVVVPVHVSPRFALDIQPDACINEIVNLAVTNPTVGIDNFNWHGFDGGEMVYGAVTAGPYGIRWNSPGEKIIKVVATDDGCKSLDVFDTIMIHDLPDAQIFANKTEVCSGDTIEFSGRYDANYSYQWEPYQFFGASHGSVDTAIIDFTGYVRLNVINEYNCRASDSILITAEPCCDIYFPNAFTPNNDGRNDFFRVITTGTHEITVFRVANRWGQTVYETKDELRGWDGTFNGVPQDMGTYFYYIKYKCSDGNFYEEKGEVVLVR